MKQQRNSLEEEEKRDSNFSFDFIRYAFESNRKVQRNGLKREKNCRKHKTQKNCEF